MCETGTGQTRLEIEHNTANGTKSHGVMDAFVGVAKLDQGNRLPAVGLNASATPALGEKRFALLDMALTRHYSRP